MNTLCIVLLVSLTGYVRSVAVNETCGNPTPACDPNLYCENGQCKVKATMACTAESTDECIMGATCVDSKCKCGANHTPSADMTKCLKYIDQQCTAANNDCVLGATCVGDSPKCTCNATTMAKSDKSKCLMKIGGMCEVSTDCVQDGEKILCTDKKCACADKYAPNDMMNMCKLKLNQTCTADDDCGMNAMCSTGTPRKCTCKVNFTSDGNSCESGSAAVVASLFLLVAAFVTSRLMLTRDQ